jgi:hypothetical protein
MMRPKSGQNPMTPNAAERQHWKDHKVVAKKTLPLHHWRAFEFFADLRPEHLPILYPAAVMVKAGNHFNPVKPIQQ